MTQPCTFRTLALLMAGYGLLLLPGAFWPAYLDSPVGILLVFPYLSVYVFHGLGVPGVLQNHGACGWGWCAPTPFGWLFLSVFWLAVAWLVAWGLASLTRPPPGR